MFVNTTVTAKNIKEGKQCRDDSCPLALSFLELPATTFGSVVTSARVNEDDIEIKTADGRVFQSESTKRANLFMNKFDETRLVKPSLFRFQFKEVEVEKGWF